MLTGALSSYPHYYGMLTFNGKAVSYEAKSLQVTEADRSPEEFLDWSRAFFDSSAARKFRDALAEKDLSAADQAQAIEAFTELNRLYFAGRSDQFRQIAGLDVLRACMEGDGMLEYYVRSILAEPARDSRRVQIR